MTTSRLVPPLVLALLPIPAAVDRMRRLAILTPDMHRMHHPVEDHETNNNFGRTSRIPDCRRTTVITDLCGMLILLAFAGHVSDYAINWREWSRYA